MAETFHLARILLPEPVTIHLPTVSGPRPRIAAGTQPVPITAENGQTKQIDHLDAAFWINPLTRTVHAQLAPIPRALLIYGPEDFLAVAADTPAQHAERVLQLLLPDPAVILQALIDGRALPAAPPRVPRAIENWRARAVLEATGLLPAVEDLIAGLTGPESLVIRHAWQGAAPLIRTGPTVQAFATSLGLQSAQIDQMFIQAAALTY